MSQKNFQGESLKGSISSQSGGQKFSSSIQLNRRNPVKRSDETKKKLLKSQTNQTINLGLELEAEIDLNRTDLAHNMENFSSKIYYNQEKDKKIKKEIEQVSRQHISTKQVDVNYIKFLQKAQRFDLDVRRPQRLKIKYDFKSQYEVEDPKNLKTQMEQQRNEEGLSEPKYHKSQVAIINNSLEISSSIDEKVLESSIEEQEAYSTPCNQDEEMAPIQEDLDQSQAALKDAQESNQSEYFESNQNQQEDEKQIETKRVFPQMLSPQLEELIITELENSYSIKLKNKMPKIERIQLQMEVRKSFKTFQKYLVGGICIVATMTELNLKSLGILILYGFLQNELLQIYNRNEIKVHEDDETLKVILQLKQQQDDKQQYLETCNLLISLYATIPLVRAFHDIGNILQLFIILLFFKSNSNSRKRDLMLRIAIIFLVNCNFQNQQLSATIYQGITVIFALLMIVSEVSNIKSVCSLPANDCSIQKHWLKQKLNKLTFEPSIWEIEFNNHQDKGTVMGSQYSSKQSIGDLKRAMSNKLLSLGSSKDKQQSIVAMEGTSQITSQIHSNFIINSETGDMKSETRSEMRFEPQISYQQTDEEQDQESNEKSFAIREFMLNSISHGVMLCKLSRINNVKSRRQSDQCLSLKGVSGIQNNKNINNSSVEMNLNPKKDKKYTSIINKQILNRKIKLFPVQKSGQFFQRLPFYREASQFQMNKRKSSKDFFSNKVRDSALKMMNRSKSFLKNQSQINGSSEALKLDESQSLNYKKSQTTVQNFEYSDLSPLEGELLEIKIYQPYFISNGTIIQFERKNKFKVAPEKLSIMDILQSYYMENKKNSSLFFKVNLSDINDLQYMKNMTDPSQRKVSSLLEQKDFSMQSSKFYLDSKVLNSSNMEEIKELNSEQGEQSKSSLRRKTLKKKLKQSQLASIVGKMPKVDKEEKAYQGPRKQSQEIQKFVENQPKSQPIKPKTRNTSDLDLDINRSNMKQLVMNSNKGSDDSCSSDSESSCFDEDDLRMDESIEDSNSSTETMVDFKGNSQRQGRSSANEDRQDLIRYYEFEISHIDQIKDQKGLTFINIKDITKLVQNQQKFCDIIYQDAIENNFSHEQMTPLNPIINQAVMIKQRIIQLYLEKFGRVPQQDEEFHNVEGIDHNDLAIVVKNSPEAKMVIQQLTSVEQAAKLIWYYNTNQIKRMKYKKNQLDINPTPIESIEPIIYNVLWPFEHFVFKRRHNMYLIKNLVKDYMMIADWKLYELILFNIIQNSVKYNKNFDGDVVIITTCKNMKNKKGCKKQSLVLNKPKEYVLETQVIDTGIGIQEDRQNLLFIPFLELKDRIGIRKTENDNIGIGLASSREICKKMGGDIKLKLSRKGLTIFSFKIPIQLAKIEEENEINYNVVATNPMEFYNQNETKVIRLIGKNRPIPESILEVLDALNININPRVHSESCLSKGVQSKTPIIHNSHEIVKQKYGFKYIEDLSLSGSQSRKNKKELNINSKKMKIMNSKNSQNSKNRKANGILDHERINSFKERTPRTPTKSQDLYNIPKYKEDDDKSQGGFSQTFKIGVKNNKFSQKIAGKNDLIEYKQPSKRHSSEDWIFSDKKQKSSGKVNNNSDSYSLIMKNLSSEEEQKERAKSSEKPCSSQKPCSSEAKLSDLMQQEEQNLQELQEEGSVSQASNSCFFEFENENGLRSKNSLLRGSSLPPNNCFSSNRNVINRQNGSDSYNNDIIYKQPIRRKIASNQCLRQFQTKFKTMSNDQFKVLNKDTKRSLINQLICDNHRGDLCRVFSNIEEYKGNQETSSDNDSDEEVQTIILDEIKKNKTQYGIILPNNSGDSGSDSSEFLAMMSKAAVAPQQPDIEEQEQEAAESIVIRPSDFFVNQDDLANHQANHMRREGDKREIQIYNELSIQLDNSQQQNQSSVSNNNNRNNNNNHSSSVSNKSRNLLCVNPSNRVIVNPSNMSIPDERNKRSQFVASSQKEPLELLSSSVSNCGCDARILCADDNDFNLLTINTIIFNKFSIKPDEAQNGQIAVDMFKEALAQECGCPNRAYKLILMDIQMPEMDGFEATMEINKLVKQANLKNPENPIVCNILAITSYTGNDVKEKCLKLGMKQVLNKPVSSNLISEIINKYFNN